MAVSTASIREGPRNVRLATMVFEVGVFEVGVFEVGVVRVRSAHGRGAVGEPSDHTRTTSSASGWSKLPTGMVALPRTAPTASPVAA